MKTGKYIINKVKFLQVEECFDMRCTIIEQVKQGQKEKFNVYEETGKKRRILLKYKYKAKIVYPSRYDYMNGIKVYNCDKDCTSIYYSYIILNHDEKEVFYCYTQMALHKYSKEMYEKEMIDLKELKENYGKSKNENQ